MRYLIILIFSLLAACAPVTPEVRYETQVVKVPVAVPCQITVPERPTLIFGDTPKSASLYVKVQNLAADNEALEGYTKQLEGALAGCTKPLPQDVTNGK